MARIEQTAAADQNTMRPVCRGPPRSTSSAGQRAITASTSPDRRSRGAPAARPAVQLRRSRPGGPSTRRIVVERPGRDDGAVLDDIERGAKPQRDLMLAAGGAVEIDGGALLHVLHRHASPVLCDHVTSTDHLETADVEASAKPSPSAFAASPARPRCPPPRDCRPRSTRRPAPTRRGADRAAPPRRTRARRRYSRSRPRPARPDLPAAANASGFARCRPPTTKPTPKTTPRPGPERHQDQPAPADHLPVEADQRAGSSAWTRSARRRSGCRKPTSAIRPTCTARRGTAGDHSAIARTIVPNSAGPRQPLNRRRRPQPSGR